SLYGYKEIRTPIFEYTELFSKGIGEQTDVVQKEMYTFEDKGGRSLTLRPEGTAGIIRALADLAQQGMKPRVFYIGPMFRGERPAAGRKRQFHQIGIENISSPSPELDAECIIMLMHFLDSLGIKGAKLKINTRGTPEDITTAAENLKNDLFTKRNLFCDDCKKRIDRNIWRVLDCKNPECIKHLSGISPDKYFSEKSLDYLEKVFQILRENEIKFEKDSKLVRGLDYYIHTVFEVTHEGLGAQNAIAGGGRYQIFPPGAKKPIHGVGFACGMERLIIAMQAEKINKITPVKPTIFIVSLGESSKIMNLKLSQALRKNGIAVITDFENKSMKAAMRAANKSGADFTVIRGDNEIERNTIILKNMIDGTQYEVIPENLISHIRDLTQKN
ncbi:MAG TPA: histidine--tRNA ligase, partial [Victivallales bacterium]|nr:histidine--tRNA ligase [Victivallales bacterium]